MLREYVQKELENLKASLLYRRLSLDPLHFSNNDYLGLSGHPKIREAGQSALALYGTSSTGSRLLGGHHPVFVQAEEVLAQFFGAPRALFMSSGYLANLAVIGALSEWADEILSDEKNHASIVDAIRLSKKPRQIVPHNRWRDLGLSHSARQLLVSESLFSMDGDTVDIEGLKNVLYSGKRFLILDEAHAAGVFREKGTGFYWGDFERAAVVVTFGKAFGVAGAAVLCSEEVYEWMINRGRAFIYNTALPPLIPAMVIKAVHVLEAEGWRRDELWERAFQFRKGIEDFTKHKIPQRDSSHDRFSPIVPLLVPGNENILKLWQFMREFGYELRPIRYPTVPKGAERLRLSVSVGTKKDELWRFLENLKQAYSWLEMEDK